MSFSTQAHSDRSVPRWFTAVATVLLALCSVGQSAQQLPTRGTRFWAGFMQNGFAAQSLKIHITSTVSTTGTISMPNGGWSTNFSLAANAVTVVDIPTSAENSGSETLQNKGVLITSQDSVNVYMTSYQNYTYDLSQVLPESSLGTLYRVDSYQGMPNFNNLHKSELLVLATQDGTQVRITPRVNTWGGRPAGVPFVVDLNAGETYQVQAATDQLDLTGTLIEATDLSGPCRPFAVFGGSTCATAPGSCSACDHIFDQLLPIAAWGTRYYTVPIFGTTGSTYRVMAHQNNTSVTIGAGAPFILNAGQVFEANTVATPVCIEASLPVSVVQIMEGYSCVGNGDPSLLILSPAERTTKRAAFHSTSTVQVNQHSVSVVLPTSAIGQLTLDGGNVNPSLFQAYAGCPDRSWAKIPVTPGVHRLHSNIGFQAYAFGIGFGESYAASVNDIGAPAVVNDSTICGAGPFTLNSSVPLNNATWATLSDPNTIIGTGNSINVTPAGSTSYVVTGQLPVSGCPETFTYHVGIPLTIPTLLTANDEPTINVCQYQPVQLSLVPPPDPAWFNIDWSPSASLNDANVSNPLAAPVASTWYKVEVESPNGCGDMVDSILVQVQPGAIIELNTTATPAVVCAGTTVQLGSSVLRAVMRDDLESATGPSWTAVQGGSIGNQCGSIGAGALYFNGNGQRYAQTVALNTSNGGRIRFQLKMASGSAPCDDIEAGEEVVLEYSTNNGLNWGGISTFGEDYFPTLSSLDIAIPAAAQSNSTMFRWRQTANSGAGQDNWVLDAVLIGAYDDAYASYAWSQPATLNNATASAPTAAPTASGWYVLSATDPLGGCIYGDSVFVQVEPAFNLSVTPSTTLCSLTGTQLQATPSSGTGIAYTWTPNDGSLSSTTIADPIATPAQTTTYNVVAQNAAGCSASGSVTLTVGQLFGLNVTVDSDTLCQGQSAQLNAAVTGGSGLTYAWSGAGLNNSAIPNPIATPALTTTYTCTVTHTPSGCQLSASVTVVVNTGYTANAGTDQTVCSALGIQLGVQHNVPNAQFAWTPAANVNAANIAAPTITVDATATFTVTVTDLQGCSVSDQVTITRAFPNGNNTQSVAACANAAPTLTAPVTGVSYAWSTGANTPSIVPASSGPHTVTVTNAQGCESINTFNVTLHALPIVDLGPDQIICGNAPITLNAGNPGASFAWSTSAQTQTINVSTSGNYSVTVTNANNCTASDAVNVQFNPLPVDVLTDATACASTPPTLNAGNSGSTFLWNTGAQGQDITPTTSGTYSVTITTAQQCSATYDAVVTLAPVLGVELGSDTTICQGASLTLDAGNTGASFVWSNGPNAQSITVTNAGTYSVTVSNGYCSATDDLSLNVANAPTDVLTDATRCTGESVTLDAGNAGSTYLWNNSSISRTIEVTVSGLYTVVVTNAAGCTGNFNANVQFIAPPNVYLGMDTVLCEGEMLTVDAGNPGSSYTWSTGANTRTIGIGTAGTYSVTVNNGSCSRSDDITVLFNPSPARMAVNEFHTCLDDAPKYVVIDAGNAGSRFDWSTGETSQVILASAYGWYYVQVTNAYDCSGRDSARVIEYCPATIFIPNTFTPNGDGVNDIFLPVGKSIASIHMVIHDRWGELIFETDDINTGWDGTYQGEVVKNDTYVWRLEYQFYTDKEGTLGVQQTQMGHIQVLL